MSNNLRRIIAILFCLAMTFSIGSVYAQAPNHTRIELAVYHPDGTVIIQVNQALESATLELSNGDSLELARQNRSLPVTIWLLLDTSGGMVNAASRVQFALEDWIQDSEADQFGVIFYDASVRIFEADSPNEFLSILADYEASAQSPGCLGDALSALNRIEPDPERIQHVLLIAGPLSRQINCLENPVQETYFPIDAVIVADELDETYRDNTNQIRQANLQIIPARLDEIEALWTQPITTFSGTIDNLDALDGASIVLKNGERLDLNFTGLGLIENAIQVTEAPTATATSTATATLTATPTATVTPTLTATLTATFTPTAIPAATQSSDASDEAGNSILLPVGIAVVILGLLAFAFFFTRSNKRSPGKLREVTSATEPITGRTSFDFYSSGGAYIPADDLTKALIPDDMPSSESTIFEEDHSTEATAITPPAKSVPHTQLRDLPPHLQEQDVHSITKVLTDDSFSAIQDQQNAGLLAWLHLEGETPQYFEIREKSVTIGSAVTCDITLGHDTDVAPKHITIEQLANKDFRIQVEASTVTMGNINIKTGEKRQLFSQDIIQLSPHTRLVFIANESNNSNALGSE